MQNSRRERAAASGTGPGSALAVLAGREVRLRAATAEPNPFDLATARSSYPRAERPPTPDETRDRRRNDFDTLARGFLVAASRRSREGRRHAELFLCDGDRL